MSVTNWSCCGNAASISGRLCPPLLSSACFNRHQQLSILTRPTINRRVVLRCTAATTRGCGVERWPSAWDDKPYEIMPNGKIIYIDEQDVVAFLDPPIQLIPLDPSSYNPAAYLWKKIQDIPEERRHRLLSLLKPRLISTAWEIAGARYDDPKLAVKGASSFLSDGPNSTLLPEYWNCRTSGGPLTISWISSFKKALFYTNDRKPYGRLIGGGSLLSGIWPLYFTVSQLDEVISTEQPCDFAYEFGDGLLNLTDYPQDFPTPAKHPWPFNDQVMIYVRHLGPGVMIGQAWQEGEALEQVPKKLTSTEILMVKDYYSVNH